MAQPKRIYEYRGKKENKNAVLSTQGGSHKYTYKPANKEERAGRKRVWDRFTAMRDDPIRKEEERQWELGDKIYRMWAPEREKDDWRADIILPDGFSAIQAHMQETIDLRARPMLEGVESSDLALESFVNAVYQGAMDKTEFDYETYRAKNCAAIRGTAFTLEEWRYETRTVQDPVAVQKDGTLEYKEREIVDYDDVYTRHVDNYACFFDPGASHPKYGQDCIYREIISYDTFLALYKDKPGFQNTEEVVPAKSVGKQAGYFKQAEDIEEDDVELLHYWNRLTDSYDVLANNVLIRQGPLPSRHKELPMDVWVFYPVDGRIYGMGIPRIIYSLMEERRSIRNMSLDRQKMHLAKMFIVNDLFDFDEDELTPRPHGMIKVNNNGMPLNQSIMPLEYGDTPVSSMRMDETLLTDERRAHGLDDRPAQTAGGTATESAILKEAAQRRINLINTLTNMDTMIRLGRKKWSNIQFYYPEGRWEETTQNNETKRKKVYKSIKVEGRDFKLAGDPEKGEETELVVREGDFSSRIKIDAKFGRYLTGDFDITVDAASSVVVSKAIKRAQTKEFIDSVFSNPILSRFADGQKALKRWAVINDEKPKDWMAGEAMTEDDQKVQAEQENAIFMRMEETGKIYAVPGTPGATTAHTEQHLNFTETAAYMALSQPVKDVITKHIMDENEKNPDVPNLADMGGGGAPPPGGGPEQGGGGNAVLPGAPGGPLPAEATVGGAPAVGGDVTAGNELAI